MDGSCRFCVCTNDGGLGSGGSGGGSTTGTIGGGCYLNAASGEVTPDTGQIINWGVATCTMGSAIVGSYNNGESMYYSAYVVPSCGANYTAQVTEVLNAANYGSFATQALCVHN